MRRVVLTILGVLAIIAGSAYVVRAASPKPDFGVSAAPTTRTVNAGASTTYAVTLSRTGGFTGAVQLSASGLPRDASANFVPGSLSGSQTGSNLTVSTSSSTSPGTYTVTVTGRSGSTSHTTSVTLVVPKPDFTLSATPTSRTIPQGGSTTYEVTVQRTGGYTGTVHLGAIGLIFGAAASFSPSSLSPGHDSSTLTVATSGLTAPGSYTLYIIGLGGDIAHATQVTLVVTKPDFSVSATPASQTVAQGDSTSYTVTVNRSGGFAGPVSLSASGLPSGAAASWAPSATVPASGTTATLIVHAGASTPVATSTLKISGSATLPGGTAVRSTTVTLKVQAATSSQFTISGNLPQPLYPGVKRALDLTITNPNSFDIKVTSLTVAMRDATSKAGCSGSQNFAVDQFSGTYPLTVHPGTASLSSLVGDSSKWPQLRMLNLPTNQDACKSAALTLDYGGSATQ